MKKHAKGASFLKKMLRGAGAKPLPKQIQRERKIYLAPEILGKYEDSTPIAIDERNDNARLDPRNIETKITIYEREVNEWFLIPASNLLEQNSFNNSFIVLMICMSYLEGVEQYKTGIDSSGRSKKCFIDSLKRLYPNQYSNEDIGKLYSKSRCGLFCSSWRRIRIFICIDIFKHTT